MKKLEAYSALSDLIFRGFLTTEMKIVGKSFIFKTITDKEHDLIKAMTGKGDGPLYNWKFNLNFMAHSLLFVEGKNMLVNRADTFNFVHSLFLDIPDILFGKIMKELNELRSYSFDVFRYLEGFSYTNKSRRSWKNLIKNPPNDERFTGIPGTASMGLNVHQESWIAINRALDEEDDYNKNFNLSLLIASASNPKGVRKIRNHHDLTIKTAEDHRQKLAKKGVIDTKEWSEEKWAAPVDTAEELLAELERQMKGMKDRHDIFMEKYRNKMREEAQKREKEALARIKRAREAAEGQPDITSSQRVLTPEEVEELEYKRKKGTVSVKSEQHVNTKDKNKFYKKVGSRVLTGRK